MSLLSRTTELTLRVALRRWPAQLRATLDREWHAELHALGEEPGGTAYRRLRFGLSLAVRGTGQLGGVSWPEAQPGRSPLVALPATALVVGVLGWIAGLRWLSPIEPVGGYPPGWTKQMDRYVSWAFDVRVASILLIVLGLLGWLCRRKGALTFGFLSAEGLFIVDYRLKPELGTANAAGIAVLAVAVLVVLAWGVRRLAPASQRGVWQLIAGSVVAAYAAPALLFRGLWEPPVFNPIPTGLVPASVTALGLLVAVAVGFALAARQQAISPRSILVIAFGCGLAATAGALPLMTGGFTPVAQSGPLLVVAVAMLRRGRGGHRWPRAIAGWALCLAIAAAAWIPATYADFFLPFISVAPVDFTDHHPAVVGAFGVGVLTALISVWLELGRSAAALPVTEPQSAADRDAGTDDARLPSRTRQSGAAR